MRRRDVSQSTYQLTSVFNREQVTPSDRNHAIIIRSPPDPRISSKYSKHPKTLKLAHMLMSWFIVRPREVSSLDSPASGRPSQTITRTVQLRNGICQRHNLPLRQQRKLCILYRAGVSHIGVAILPFDAVRTSTSGTGVGFFFFPVRIELCDGLPIAVFWSAPVVIAAQMQSPVFDSGSKVPKVRWLLL